MYVPNLLQTCTINNLQALRKIQPQTSARLQRLFKKCRSRRSESDKENNSARAFRQIYQTKAFSQTQGSGRFIRASNFTPKSSSFTPYSPFFQGEESSYLGWRWQRCKAPTITITLTLTSIRQATSNFHVLIRNVIRCHCQPIYELFSLKSAHWQKIAYAIPPNGISVFAESHIPFLENGYAIFLIVKFRCSFLIQVVSFGIYSYTRFTRFCLIPILG